MINETNTTGAFHILINHIDQDYILGDVSCHASVTYELRRERGSIYASSFQYNFSKF